MHPLTEAYEAERADFQRVLTAIRKLLSAPMADLCSHDWLTELIREVGLVPIPDAERTYAGDTQYLNSSQQGVIQLPDEFASYLLLLGREKPSTYLEIGTFNGATACLTAAYVQRFVSNFQITTLDIFPAFIFFEEASALLPNLSYGVGKTSFEFRGRQFDAVFIDGDHSFEWAWADYRNVGRFARVCAFHDVNNAPYRNFPMGGVPAVWELVKESEPGAQFHEIFEHPAKDLLGIGVRVNAT